MMKRMISMLMVLLFFSSTAWAVEIPLSDRLAMLSAMNPIVLETAEIGDWTAVRLMRKQLVLGVGECQLWEGMLFDTQTGRRVVWEDLLGADSDALSDLIESVYSKDAYAMQGDITPVPSDNFTLMNGQFILYYPPQQLSNVQGRAGGFAFYPHELPEFLMDFEPLLTPQEGLASTMETMALPGIWQQFPIGSSIEIAVDALDLAGVPDSLQESRGYHFEAPEMRGGLLYSTLDADPLVKGQATTRMDFYGLVTGITARQEIITALGEPDHIDLMNGHPLFPGNVEQLTYRGASNVGFVVLDGIFVGIIIVR